MDVTTGITPARVRRVLLLALFAGITWCVFSLFFPSTSASAAENDRGSGLLGAVGSVVDGVSGAVSETTAAVDTALTGTVEAVTPAVAPVTAPVAVAVPAPITQPVGDVVQTVTRTADATVGRVDAVVTDVVNETTSAAAEIADAGLVSEVVAPVTEVVAEVPVLGAIVTEAGLDETVGDVADAVDGTVSTVVGSAPRIDSVLPDLPGGAIDPVVDPIGTPSTGTVPVLQLPQFVQTAVLGSPRPAPATEHPHPGITPAAARSTGGHAPASRLSAPGAALVFDAAGSFSANTALLSPVSTEPTGAADSPAGGLRGVLGSSSAAGSAGPGSAVAETIPGDSINAASSLSLFRTDTDDALPGAPVFDTDVAPD